MIFVSLDIETLGLNELAPIIEVGMVAVRINGHDAPEFATKLAKYQTYVIHDRYDNCEPYAMSMNARALRHIASRGKYTEYKYTHINFLAGDMLGFLEGIYGSEIRGKNLITFAGKNVGSFDLKLLEKQAKLSDCFTYHHRCIDVGNLFWDPRQDDGVPDTKTCFERAGFSRDVDHTALIDADDCADLVIHFACECSRGLDIRQS